MSLNSFDSSYIDRFNKSNVSGTILDAAFTPGTPGQLFISINGDIETLNAHAFGESIIGTIKSNRNINTIIFDFYKVPYLSSSGVGSIIHILTIPERKNIDIYFLNVNMRIQSVFKVLGFANLIKILKDDAFQSKFPLELDCPECNQAVRVKKMGNNFCPHCGANFNSDE